MLMAKNSFAPNQSTLTMKQIFTTLYFLLLISTLLPAQLPQNGFEGNGTDTWGFTASPTKYNLPAEDDIWSDTTAMAFLAPHSGNGMWFMRDLDNPNFGGDFFHTLTFETVSISDSSASSVSFYYYTLGYEPSDSLGYIIAFDNDTLWDMSQYVDLNRNTGSWQKVEVSIPSGTQYVRLRLMAKQNGNNDYAAFDDVSILQQLPTPTIEFTEEVTQVSEADASAVIHLAIANAGSSPSMVKVLASSYSTAIAGVDYTLADSILTFNGQADTLAIQVNILDDNLQDAGRYLVLEIVDFDNAAPGSRIQHAVLISDNDIEAPAPLSESLVKMSHLGSFQGSPNGGSAEISAYDPLTKHLFIANSSNNALDLLDLTNPLNAQYVASVDMSAYGGSINSVAVKNNLVACAVSSSNPDEPGKVVFFGTDGSYLNAVNVGVHPDMVIFTHDGMKALTANEGEPSDDYTSDPLGSVSIIDLTAGVANLTDAHVATLTFESFDNDAPSLTAQGVRVFGPNATLSKDLEPEYICVSPDDQKALVTLQEANAIALVDLVGLQILNIVPLGTKDHALLANTFDASNVAPGIFMANWPVKSYLLPDAIECFEVQGQTYAITANEGDTRDYSGFSEETRVGDVVLDSSAFPDAAILQREELLGRLLITNTAGDTDNDGDYDELYSIGGRSFSIWNVATGQLVWDSGDQLERITANDPLWGQFFNSSNGNTPGFKSRSDDKGPEPESVLVVEIEGRWFAFVGLERIGGVMLYEVTNPTNPVFIQYLNTRNPAGGGDLGPEGLLFIPKDESPNGRNLLVVSNEESGTVSIFQLELDLTKGGPYSLETYEYVDPNPIVALPSGDVIYDGGLSGLHYIPGTDNEFYTLSDRGPNASATNHPNATGSTILLPKPDYAPLITRFKAENGVFTVQSIAPVLRPDGSPTTGLPLPDNAGATGETAWADTTPVVLNPDIWGLDAEGIVQDQAGNLWLCDEYGSSVWQIDGSTYQVIKRYTPFPMEAEDVALPAEIGLRRPNRGFEGIAQTPNGLVYAILQDPAYNPNSSAGLNSRLVRMVQIDPLTNDVKTFAYELNNDFGQIRKRDWKIGDLVAINNHSFLLIEHAERNGWNVKNIYRIDISDATPIDTFSFGGLTLEQVGDAATLSTFGAKAVHKELFFDLLEAGWDLTHDKPEGLTIVNDSTIAVVNDNDFGIDSPSEDGQIVFTGKTTRLYLYQLNKKLGIYPVVSFDKEVLAADEGSGVINLGLKVEQPSRFGGFVTLKVISASTATEPDDYLLSTTTVAIPPFAEGDLGFTVQLPDNSMATGGKYLILQIDSSSAVRIGDESELTLLIKDNDLPVPSAQADPYLTLSHLSSFQGSPNGGSAEISAYDAISQRLFITNIDNNTLDIVDFSNPLAAVPFASISLDNYGAGINSVSVKNGVVAVAVEADTVGEAGKVLFFNADGQFINEVNVGVQPDMVVFSEDGSIVMTANEGEPSDDYLNDPEGSVSIINLSPGVENITNADVTTLGFDAFNSQIDALKIAGVRIFGPNATVAQDLEPEYICISPDNTFALVTLQEANAVAVVDIIHQNIVAIQPLGTKNLNDLQNVQDVSDRSPDIFFAKWPVKSFFLPDAIACFESNGIAYAITANEGDSRDYDGYSEETRVKNLQLDPQAFPDAHYLQQDALLGRMLTTTAQGDTDGDGDFDEIYAYGGRSFSIWNLATGELVFDSGDDLEQIIANDPLWSPFFNASNNNTAFKNRSDDKGPEPETVLVEQLDGKTFAFIALERIGGVMVYDLSNPAQPEFIQYINTRDTLGGGDLGPEGMIFIPYTESPNHENLLVVSNEVSGTLSVFRVNLNCNISIGDDQKICQGEVATFSVPADFDIFAWSNGANTPTISVTLPGTYFVEAISPAGCVASDTAQLIVNELPIVDLGQDQYICFGETALLEAGAGYQHYQWNTNDTTFFILTSTEGAYSVTVTDANNCSNSDTVLVFVNPLPQVNLGPDTTIFDTTTYILDAGAGFLSYLWSDGSTNQTLLVEATGTYSVTVADDLGCTASDTVNITVLTDAFSPNIMAGRMLAYPNPASEFVNIELVNFEPSHYTLQLFDALGHELRTLSGRVDRTHQTLQLDLTTLPAGTYLVKISSPRGYTTTLVIVE